MLMRLLVLIVIGLWLGTTLMPSVAVAAQAAKPVAAIIAPKADDDCNSPDCDHCASSGARCLQCCLAAVATGQVAEMPQRLAVSHFASGERVLIAVMRGPPAPPPRPQGLT
jgi:hypothetical protein